MTTPTFTPDHEDRAVTGQGYGLDANRVRLMRLKGAYPPDLADDAIIDEQTRPGLLARLTRQGAVT